MKTRRSGQCRPPAAPGCPNRKEGRPTRLPTTNKKGRPDILDLPMWRTDSIRPPMSAMRPPMNRPSGQLREWPADK